MKTIFLDCCPVCSSDFRHWKTKTTFFGDFNIVLCNGCGFAFVNPRPTLEYLRVSIPSGDMEIGGVDPLLRF